MCLTPSPLPFLLSLLYAHSHIMPPRAEIKTGSFFHIGAIISNVSTLNLLKANQHTHLRLIKNWESLSVLATSVCDKWAATFWFSFFFSSFSLSSFVRCKCLKSCFKPKCTGSFSHFITTVFDWFSFHFRRWVIHSFNLYLFFLFLTFVHSGKWKWVCMCVGQNLLMWNEPC